MANTKRIRTNQAIDGTLSVAGASSFAAITVTTFSSSGAAAFPGGITGGITVSGNSAFNNNLHVIGNLVVDGSFSFAGGSTFPDNTFAVQDNVDPTKQLMASLGGATTGTTTTLTFVQTVDRVVTFPDADIAVVGTVASQSLTNKTIDADANTISNIDDNEIKVGANILRSKLATGTINQVVINDGSGVLSSEAQLSALRGGTGQDFSASTGVIKVAGGTFSASTIVNADINAAAAIAYTKLVLANSIVDADVNATAAIARSKIASGSANHVLINSGAGAMSSEAALAASRGGLAADASAFTGVVKASGGVFSASTLVNADVDAAAAITRSKLAVGTANHVVINSAGGVLTSEASLAESRGGTAQSTYTTGDTLYASAANTLSKRAIGTVGQVYKVNGSGVPAWEDQSNPTNDVRLFEDWLTDGTGMLRWLGTVVGAGATNTTTGNIAVNTNSHPGVLELATGTTATGQSARYLGGVATGAATAGFVLGGGAMSQEWLVSFEDLSTAGERYNFDMGIYDAETLAVNTLRFRYSDNLNAGNWTAETIAASTTTATDTGVAATADTWFKLRIDVDAAATSITYYINGALVATHSTNIPTGILLAPRSRMIKSVGTTSRSGYIDYFKFYQRLTTAR